MLFTFLLLDHLDWPLSYVNGQVQTMVTLFQLFWALSCNALFNMIYILNLVWKVQITHVQPHV